jgi:hypothetical protein
MQKFIYLLEQQSGKQPVNVGVFTSLSRAKRFVKKLPKSLAYAVYQLPTNKCLTQGRKLKDVQGMFDHWHFGTDEVEQFSTGKKGRVIRKKKRMLLGWPK